VDDLAWFGTVLTPQPWPRSPASGAPRRPGSPNHYPRCAPGGSDNPFKQQRGVLPVRAALLQAVVDGLAIPACAWPGAQQPRALDTWSGRPNSGRARLSSWWQQNLLPQIQRGASSVRSQPLAAWRVVPRLAAA